MFENHSRSARADQDPYASRVYLRIWLNEEKKKWVGRQRAVFKKALGHSAVVMADLSKMALVWFTEKVKTALSHPRQRVLFKFITVLCLSI